MFSFLTFLSRLILNLCKSKKELLCKFVFCRKRLKSINENRVKNVLDFGIQTNSSFEAVLSHLNILPLLLLSYCFLV
jgi:hypothetical protein